MDQTSLDGFNGDPQTLNGTVGQLHANALNVGFELTLCDFGHVRADAAALLSDTFAVNDTSRGGTFSSDGTDSGHGFA